MFMPMDFYRERPREMREHRECYPEMPECRERCREIHEHVYCHKEILGPCHEHIHCCKKIVKQPCDCRREMLEHRRLRDPYYEYYE